jgi:hypothetical protein
MPSEISFFGIQKRDQACLSAAAGLRRATLAGILQVLDHPAVFTAYAGANVEQD